MPGEAKVRRWVVVGQSGGGGLLHETPVHGFALQALLAHPKGQVVSVGMYVHVPPAQVPDEAKVRRVVALVQVAAGGEVQANVWEEYPHVPPVQVPGDE